MVAQSVAWAVDADHGGAVQEPVEHRGGDGGVAEGCCPVSDSDVGGQDCRAFEVALVDYLEQGGGAVAGQREIAQLVDLCGCPHRSTYADIATMPRMPQGRVLVR